MPRPGRPRSPRAASAQIVRIKLRLYRGEDDDLIAFFVSITPRLRALSVKLALRSGVQSADMVVEKPDETMLDDLDVFVF